LPGPCGLEGLNYQRGPFGSDDSSSRLHQSVRVARTPIWTWVLPPMPRYSSKKLAKLFR
jgi:hypothetical protein